MGLTTKELAQIREQVSAGKRPRVMFTEAAGQIAGQVGHVVKLEDPKKHDDWILVKFGADVLPFPPADLAIAPRGAVKKAAPEPEPPAPPAPEFKVVREAPPTKSQAATPAATQEKKKTVSEADKTPEGGVPAAAGTAAAPAPRKPAAGAGASGKGKAKPLPSFTVTLAYAEGEWTVGAVQGSKTLAKPYVIKPAEALKMVSLIDVPGVHEAVEHILSAERAEAQAHAEKLRAELAELEAKLAELGAA